MICFYLFLLATVSSMGLRQSAAPKIQVDFFFESLCSGCAVTLRTELYTIKNDPELNAIVNLNIYPYGNAHILTRDPPTFKCQHGEPECYGNMIMLCGMEYFPEIYFPFLDCIEANKNFDDASVLSCAAKTGLKGEPILKCAKGTEGPLLHLKAGDATPADHKYVPWNVIDGKHYEYNFSIVGVVCDLYTGVKPKICGAEKVDMKLFYESYCPGCRDLITTELYKFRLGMGVLKNIDLTLYPFGNGKILTRDPPTFKCQHGEPECYGNMVENCIIEHTPVWYEFVSNIESRHNFTDAAVTEVAEKLRIAPAPIITCIHGTEGPLLHLKAADATPADHKWVPWLLFNGKLIGDQESVLERFCKDFKGVTPLACRDIKSEEEVEELTCMA